MSKISSSKTGPKYCRICLDAHDQEIHRATENVRAWFRDQVTTGFAIAAREPIATVPKPVDKARVVPISRTTPLPAA